MLNRERDVEASELNYSFGFRASRASGFGHGFQASRVWGSEAWTPVKRSSM